MFRSASFLIVALAALSFSAVAQVSQLDQIQIAPPMRQVQPPSPTASVKELDAQAEELRSRNDFLDAIDYFRAALSREPDSAVILNKLGICELMLRRFPSAGKIFELAIKKDRSYAEAYNNLGVVDYERRKYGASVKRYKKAIAMSPDSASFYSNLGASYFAQKKFELASQAYLQALKLDPTIFEHSSRTGIAAQIASTDDRAHYDYVLAKLYAKMGDSNHSLEYLRKAMEDGYKKVEDVYIDPEFADLRKDTRFAELMKAKPPAIPE
jgi:tetratricopeptide (TPR) repeat protein